jgi:hypothetical protein
MTERSQLAPPEGVLPGHLGLILFGRVIMGDIGATMVDLALRQGIRAEEAPDGEWLVSHPTGRDTRTLAGYEKTLVEALPGVPVPLTEVGSSVPEDVRKALVHEGVARGWLRRLHHDQRTPAAEDLTAHVRAFGRQMRQLRRDHGQDALGGTLLPYALRFGLATGDTQPLVRLNRAWVDRFADLPGWRPVTPARTFDEITITPNPYADLGRAGMI